MSVSHLRWSAPVLMLAAGSIACTYNPQPQDGMQACYENRCPDGYVCALDNRCYRPEHVPVLPGSGGQGGGLGGNSGAGGVTGMTGRGGVTGIGSGGNASTGGVMGIGGMVGSGGGNGPGGSTGTGGTTTPPNTGTVMTVANGQAQGAMTGYGWVALAALDTITDPTCDSPAGPIVSGLDCTRTIWSTTDSFCLSARIPKLPSAPTDEDFALNWGITLGVSATPDNGVLGQSFSSITASLTGSPMTGLRVTARLQNDPAELTYCADLIPGKAISFASFNSACWDSSGKYLAATEVARIREIGVMIPSTTASSITISNLCLLGLTFGR